MPVLVINMQHTGENIIALRQLKGFSVKDLQQKLGFTSPQTIYKWQRGECMPSIDSLVMLSALFGVSINAIVAVEPIYIFQPD